MTIYRSVLSVAVVVLATVAAQAENPRARLGQRPLAAEESAASTQAKKPVYRPPMRGAPTRRVGGATRGFGEENIFVAVLAPEGTGFTSRESPTLYWFVSRATTRQVAFALIRDDQIEPVAELTLDAPAVGGIARISLSDLGVSLAPGIVYEWSIALVKDPLNRSTDIVTSGTVVHKVPDRAIRDRLHAADPEARFALYGEAGYWYDAIDLASDAILSASTASQWRRLRASFLEQVGLERVAAYDRPA